jgi:hypothetical protein
MDLADPALNNPARELQLQAGDVPIVADLAPLDRE